MRAKISYKTAQERHPEAVDMIVGLLRKGRTVYRETAPEDMRWIYEYDLIKRSISFDEVVSGNGRPFETRESIGEEVECSLFGRIGTWSKGERVEVSLADIQSAEKKKKTKEGTTKEGKKADLPVYKNHGKGKQKGRSSQRLSNRDSQKQ